MSEEDVMGVQVFSHGGKQGTLSSSAPATRFFQPVGRFTLHFLQMCMVMCMGAVALSLLFFGAARLLGYTNLDQQAPELTVFVIAVNLSLPMLVWMRRMGMAWRPTLEMAGSTTVAGLLLIVAYWLDLVAKSDLIPLQTGLLACPLMLVVMLFRFRLYAVGHTHERAHATSQTSAF